MSQPASEPPPPSIHVTWATPESGGYRDLARPVRPRSVSRRGSVRGLGGALWFGAGGAAAGLSSLLYGLDHTLPHLTLLGIAGSVVAAALLDRVVPRTRMRTEVTFAADALEVRQQGVDLVRIAYGDVERFECETVHDALRNDRRVLQHVVARLGAGRVEVVFPFVDDVGDAVWLTAFLTRWALSPA